MYVWASNYPSAACLRALALLFIALALVPCDAHSVSTAKRLRALRRPPLDILAIDDVPFCTFGARSTFGGEVQVIVRHDNVRQLQFNGDGVAVQTSVACKGQQPPNCTSTGHQTQACDSLACPCRPDLSFLKFKCLQGMMDQVQPMCSARSTDKLPFRILLIGLGGGALPMYALSRCPKGTKIDVVEYDPRVIDAAINFFGLRINEDALTVETNDGGKAIQERVGKGAKYDVVLVDAFQSAGHVPDSCRNASFIAGTRRILRPHGRVIQHIWSPQYETSIKDYRRVYGQHNVRGEDMDLGISHLIVAQAGDSSSE